MARTPSPVPLPLTRDAFTVHTARAHGLTRHIVGHRRFAAPHHGVRKLFSVETTTSPSRYDEVIARERAADYAPLLRPGEAFSHTTALLLLGAPIHCQPTLHVTAPPPFANARGRNVRGYRTRTAFTPLNDASGLRCVPHLLALQQSASLLPFKELVVALDFVLSPRTGAKRLRPLLTHAELEACFESFAGRGVLALRAALSVARVGAESRMESLLHFELARLGLDSLELQAEIFDVRGQWIGRFDMVDRQRRLIIEYDGEQHRLDRRQYLRDEQRLDAVRAEGYTILRLRREDSARQNLARTRANLCAFLGARPRTIDPRLARYFGFE